jgi:CubicO group peptidase (beta-lactamase class C family)
MGGVMNFTRRSAVAGGLALAATASPVMARQPNSAIDAEAASFLATTRAPGLQVAMARNGTLGFVGAWGRADQAGAPLTHDHRFRIASLSKPITAAAVMRLIETGRLTLDSTIFGPGSILGDRFGPTSGPLRALRVRHLLNHTAGGWTNDGRDPVFAHPDLDQRQLIARTLAERPLEAAPGTRQSYSNFAYLILGRVIEQVTGEPYEGWVRRDVLSRCGAGGMRVGDRARGVGEVEYRALTIFDDPTAVDVRRMDANGGWIASARELVGFVTAVDGTEGPGRILRPASARLMATGPFAGAAYGHGWQINQWDNWWHTGIIHGTAAFMCKTRSGYVMAALTNTGGPGSDVTLKLDQMMWRMAAAIPGWRP